MRHRRTSDERGVAMVTVLLIGAALTALTSVATFATINELRASLDDRKASEAVAIAEAGIDRMLEYIRSGDVTWNDIRLAGCTVNGITYPPVRVESPAEQGTLGSDRWFDVELTVYDVDNPAPDRLPPGACAGRTTAINGPVDLYFAITSEGHHPTATRVLRQLIVIDAVELPVGIFADRADANGSPSMNTISLISRTVITGREKIAFVGNDPYYKKGTFWPGIDAARANEPKPAAAHALGPIYLKSDNQTNQVEHKPGFPLNCTANGGAGTAGQSQWDQSGDGGLIATVTPCAAGQGAPPPTSKFTPDDIARVTPNPRLTDQDYFALRETARRTGLYCLFKANGTEECKRAGVAWTPNGTVNQADVDVVTNAPNSNRTFVAYFEYENAANRLTSNLVHFKAGVSPCSENPALNKFMVLVVRNGSFQTEGSALVNGFFMVPEGVYSHQGTATINGTIIAERFQNLGNGSFQLDECWLNNMPGPFLDISPSGWQEIDR